MTKAPYQLSLEHHVRRAEEATYVIIAEPQSHLISLWVARGNKSLKCLIRSNYHPAAKLGVCIPWMSLNSLCFVFIYRII